MNALTDMNERRTMNAVIAVSAALLFLSPWLFGFAGEGAAAWSAWIAGAAILAVAVGAMFMEQTWHEWVALAFGLWVVLAPWLLGFTAVTAALWLHVASGAAVMILATIMAWQLHATPRKARPSG